MVRSWACLAASSIWLHTWRRGGNTVSHPWCRLRWFEDTTPNVHASRGLRGKVDVLVTHLCLVGFLRLLPLACRLQLEQDPKAQHACKRGQRGSTQGRRHRQHASTTPIGSSQHMTPARTQHSSTGRGERPGINLKRVSEGTPVCSSDKEPQRAALGHVTHSPLRLLRT